MKIPPPGVMVSIGPRKLHVLTHGHGTPVVILEAGIAATSISWAVVQSKVAEFTTVISYDRAGLGWSDPAPRRSTAATAAEDLEHLLGALKLPGPFVLVGHSFGGLIVRIFEQRNPRQVAGLVLLDPVVRDEWRSPNPDRAKTLARGVTLSRRGALLARFGIVRAALSLLLSGSQRIPKLLSRFSAGDGAGVANQLAGEVRKMPRELWPAIAAHWSEPRAFETMAANLESLPASANELDETSTLGDLPIIVISAKHGAPEHQADAALSTRGEHIDLPTSGHWVQLDAPEIVIEAIRRLCQKSETIQPENPRSAHQPSPRYTQSPHTPL